MNCPCGDTNCKMKDIENYPNYKVTSCGNIL